MVARPGDTVPSTEAQPRADVASGPCLFLVAQGTRLLEAPARVLLGALDEVRIRRGERLDIAPRPQHPRDLELVLPDARISSDHARLTFVGRRWHVEDQRSRNGTFVNGARVDRATLADGDVIDVGQVILRYREHVPQDGELVYAPPAEAARGLTSLVPGVQRELDELRRMAASPVTLLVEGETGTGKEVIARAAHTLSERTGAFVGVNCGALPRERVAAELFGWKRGAFPGAVAEHAGLVRSADRGTLFLDEIADLPLGDQAALLRVLQEREVQPIAGTRPIPVDLRVIAATHQPLDELAGRHLFRADLLARLSGYRVRLTPLRDRSEDLGLLIAEVLRERHAARAGAVTIHTAALRALLASSWPANIRELVLAIDQALVRCASGTAIELRHLPALHATPTAPQAPAADDPLHAELVELLRLHRGNVAEVARKMDKARMQIHRWLKRYGIDPESFRR
ncbi:MAG: sigma-54-dependent Fis family transcriptional regulator [Deltaproteobacteria bacterium]|nr:sigma-54-dependent Fis family transcriptional regulator [Deltaproteobacteria bacterium]